MVLEAHSYVILPVFIIVSLFVIWPIRIPLGRRLTSLVLRTFCKLRIINAYDARDAGTSLHFPVDLRTAPVIGVILLVATTTIDGHTIRLGVVGDESIKPYDVLVLFISLAYISIALDGTGALEAVAFWVSKRGGSSGRLLFFYLYAFFLSVGCIVGNDPLILSGTPFLVYLTHHTGLDYEPWVFSEFMAANTASAVLVSSNPTNILITGSFQLNFLTGFTKWTILPSVVPAILNYGIILLMFRKSIPKTIVPLQEDPWSKLRDRTGAIFLTVLMLVTVAVLVGTSFVPNHAVEVWMVTAPAGILAFVYNLVSDWRDQKLRQRKIEEQEQDPAAFSGPLNRTGSNISRESPIRRRSSQQLPTMSEKPNNTTNLQPSDLALSNKEVSSLSPSSTSPTSQPTSLSDLFTTLTTRHPSTTATLNRLPIPLLPFAICFFILVRSLSQHGWIHLFATWYAHICTNPTATVFFTGFLCAAVLCPLAGTNIGATIILVEIIRDPAFIQSDAVVADQRVLWAAVYAVALGSNLGAFSFTFAGSLAGLLWRGLLRDARVGGGGGDGGRSGMGGGAVGGGGDGGRSGMGGGAVGVGGDGGGEGRGTTAVVGGAGGSDGEGERAEAGPGRGRAARDGGGGEKTEEGGGIIISQWRFAKINFFPLILQMGVACAIIVGEVYWFV